MEVATDMRNCVYVHLVELYTKFAIETFGFLTPDLVKIVSLTAREELLQMIQNGYIKDYYERMKKNAV